MTTNSKDRATKEKVDRMTVDQKVGALLTLGFNGTIVTPNISDDGRRPLFDPGDRRGF